jgi:uncharacterized membrane protein YbhN (UPF0104 family)
VSFPIACRVIVATYYLNYFPVRGAQLLTRALIAHRHGVPFLTSLPSLAVNLLARWVFIGAVLLLLGYRLAGPEPSGVLWWTGAAGIAVPIALFLFLRHWHGAVAPLVGRLVRSISRSNAGIDVTAETARALSDNLARTLHWKSLLAYAAALSVAVLLEYWALSVLWRDLGAPVFFIDLMLVFLAGGLAGWFSQLPGGFGVHELVSAYLVSLTGLDFSLALALLLVSRVLVLLADLGISAAGLALLRGIASDSEGPAAPKPGG